MRRASALFAGAVVMLVSAKASAAFHEMKVVEVYAGTTASYVQLQMYSAGQNLVSGHEVSVYDAAGVEIVGSRATFAANVASGASQDTILIGTASVMTIFGVAPDLTLPANLVQAGGAVCFDAIPVDCFTWGNFTGATTPTADAVTAPFAALTDGMAAKRKLGANATLEAGDDTNNSTADFMAGAPTPRNNAGVTGSADGGTTVMDSGTPPMDSGTTPPKDSGVSTVPTPGGGATTERADSGTSTAAAPPAEDDSGCNLSSRSSEGWATSLGLGAAAAMFVLSRRRRSKR